ncbi:alpha/beta hydrolase [Bdellovibrio bacteriovorus]|uniref:alpha/beta hydrolase n=1 Tax=Bdellovibrio bacteriovorus TaxID=959 RepID=UPI0021CEFE91|nr:alpha/beta hydrolase [Bdellovibrio bacteriovorus]UXR64691.1 alpha/beta hydrolase [Bdellovibrio bacteriovorus]
MAFDAAYQGASGGEPRQKEDPNSRSTDVSFAVDYLQSLPYVDADNIAGLGVCAGGGYTLEAAKRDHRIKAVVTISGADYGAVLRRGWEGHGDPTSATGLLNAVAQSRKAEAMGTKPAMAQYIPEKLEDIVLAELKEGHEYYKTPRCMHPNSQGNMTFSSLANIVAFDTTANLSALLMQPTLMIAGSKAGTLWISKEWNNLIKGKKQLVQIEGASHFDLYDRKAEEVTKAIIPFLKEYL